MGELNIFAITSSYGCEICALAKNLEIFERLSTRTMSFGDVIQPPIILNENARMDVGGDVNVFFSVEDAESYVEAIDVENDEYFAFDSQGRLLQFEVSGDFVRLRPAENDPSHQDVLRKLLVSLLVGMGHDRQACEAKTLANLVELFDEITISP